MDYSLLLGIHNLDKSRYNKTMEDYYNSKLDELSVEIERRNSVLIHDNNDENDGDQSPTNLSTFYTNIPQQRRSFLHQKSSVYSQSFFNMYIFKTVLISIVKQTIIGVNSVETRFRREVVEANVFFSTLVLSISCRAIRLTRRLNIHLNHSLPIV